MRSGYRTDFGISTRKAGCNRDLTTAAIVLAGISPDGVPDDVAMAEDAVPPKTEIFRIVAGSRSYDVGVTASGRPEFVFAVIWRVDGIKAYTRKLVWREADGAPGLMVANVIRMARQAASRKARQDVGALRQ